MASPVLVTETEEEVFDPLREMEAEIPPFTLRLPAATAGTVASRAAVRIMMTLRFSGVRVASIKFLTQSE
jgi:hypothetical protein